ncbi:MAG: hypothetical protein ACE5H9_01435 [Anaerolineae bacterium]
MPAVQDWFRANASLLIFLGVVVGAFLLLRTRATPLASIEDLSSMIGRGQPVVLEFYANT